VDVVIGADNLCRTAPITGERIRVAAIATADDPRLDVAILTLSAGSATPPAAIADAAGADRLIAVGWGRGSSGGPYPCRKQARALRRGEPTVCRTAQQVNPTLWHPSQICAVAAPSKRNTCVGDSGGPVLGTTATNELAVVAIINWGTGCDTPAPGFYTPTSAIRTWLEKVTTK
jgi:hypothetical protein